MGCCGGKRAQLVRSQPSKDEPSGPGSEAAPIAQQRDGRMFEYIGRGSLTVRGAISGRRYHFARLGDRVAVAYDDAFAMMAERDVAPAAEGDRGRPAAG